MIKEEDVLDEIVEAKRQGHKFIRVYLDRNMIQRNQNEIIISGVVILRGIKKGNGIGGMPDFKFEVQGGENLVFTFSKDEMEYTAWMYDDQGPGYFSPIGYNRDVLASHFDDGFFLLKDKEVHADVLERYTFLKENPGKKNIAEKIPVLASNANTVAEIDAQIKLLQDRKETVLTREHDGEGELNEDELRNNVDQKNILAKKPLGKLPKKPITDEERLRRNKQQRDYRAAKKKLKEGRIKNLQNA